MKDWLRSTTFRKRIQISLILFTVVAVIMCGLTSYGIAVRVMEKNTYHFNQIAIDKSAQSIEEKLRKIRLAVLTFMSSDQFTHLMNSISGGGELTYYEHFKLNQSLQTPIFQMKLIEPGITSIFINTSIGDFYSNSGERIDAPSFQDSILFKALESYQSPIWVVAHEDDLFNSKQRVLTLLFDPFTKNVPPNTHLAVNVSETSMIEYLQKNAGDAIPVVFTENNKLALKSGDLSEEAAEDTEFRKNIVGEKGHFEYKMNGTPYMVNYSTVSFPDNWIIVHMMDKNKLLKDVRLIQWVTICVIALFTVLTLLISRTLTSHLLRPLNDLQSVMRQVEQNDWTVRYEGHYRDEFAQVGMRFNSMLTQMVELTHEHLEAQRAEQLAELKALQAQMNPHFLYNTLNTILWKSHSNKQEEVREMIMSLSVLFRVGLNNGEEVTTVAQELEHVTQYLKIQKLCYTHLFDYTIRCSEDLRDIRLLKLLLQPLVENSILHGFKDYQGKGEIDIHVYTEDESLHLNVTDNGQGFDTLMNDSRTTILVENRKGFALENIRKRLTLYYDGEAAIDIVSNPYEQTTIKISIPLKE